METKELWVRLATMTAREDTTVMSQVRSPPEKARSRTTLAIARVINRRLGLLVESRMLTRAPKGVAVVLSKLARRNLLM